MRDRVIVVTSFVCLFVCLSVCLLVSADLKDGRLLVLQRGMNLNLNVFVGVVEWVWWNGCGGGGWWLVVWD